MTHITGILTISLRNKDTKSEGWYASIKTKDNEYLLYKKGCFPQDIETFRCFADKKVEAEGEIENTGYFSVETIRLTAEEPRQIKQKNNITEKKD